MNDDIDEEGEVRAAARRTERAMIFAKLASPFRKEEVRERDIPGGRRSRYVTAKSVMNRLDEVVGPWGWSDRYEPTPDGGFKCTLSLRLPDGQCIVREDVGARRKTNDAADAEKAAVSDAFKRAALKIGIARYLHPEGLPGWIAKQVRELEAAAR